MRLACPFLAVATAAAVSGCGIANPYTANQTKPRASTQSVPVASPTAQAPSARSTEWAVLRRYALLSINWTSRTLAANQHQLARLAVGGARAQALQTAASYGAGSTLQKSRVANRGQITSIAPGQGPRRGEWVITTEETTTGTGDFSGQPAQAHVYAAQLTHTTHGFAVSTWSPQN